MTTTVLGWRVVRARPAWAVDPAMRRTVGGIHHADRLDHALVWRFLMEPAEAG